MKKAKSKPARSADIATIEYQLPVALRKRAEVTAQRQGLGYDELIRDAIEEYMDAQEQDEADRKAIASIVERVKQCAAYTGLSIEEVGYCLLEPVLNFQPVHWFGYGPDDKHETDGKWASDALLMNEEGACVHRWAEDSKVLSLRDSVLWMQARAFTVDGGWDSEMQEKWLGRVAELMSPRM